MANDSALGEKLSSLDIVQFHSVADLRNRLEEILTLHLKDVEEITVCPRGEEFHFMACRTFVFSTPYIARSLGEFNDILQRVSINSLYYHIFDAKLRLEQNENDFSLWFRNLGMQELAEDLLQLDTTSTYADLITGSFVVMALPSGTYQVRVESTTAVRETTLTNVQVSAGSDMFVGVIAW